ncbi:MAG: class E sortase [Solirubrobacteraceae bacterium MAG38_C4-C5]|nr:class E sortase [Candidatus Siliceabacter maunaloa]
MSSATATRPATKRGAERSGGAGGWLRRLSTVLMITGFLLLADAGLTIVWQEPVSAAFAWFDQGELEDQLAQLELEFDDGGLSELERQALDGLETDELRLAYLARRLERQTEAGEAVGRIDLPTIDEDFAVVQGTDTESLRKGPGFYDAKRFPGVPGTTAIAGHRTTYGAPFNDIDALEEGDRITVTMPYARFDYSVERTEIVEPTDTEVIDDVSFDRLVLSACHPLYSAAQRIVVFAELERVTPRGPAAL